MFEKNYKQLFFLNNKTISPINFINNLEKIHILNSYSPNYYNNELFKNHFNLNKFNKNRKIFKIVKIIKKNNNINYELFKKYKNSFFVELNNLYKIEKSNNIFIKKSDLKTNQLFIYCK